MSTDDQAFRSGFVAIIGRPNVGKSTLLNRLVGQKVAITSPKPQTTRNRILGILTTSAYQVLFVDTPGIHAAKSPLNRYMVDQARAACLDVDLVLWLVEADRPLDDDRLVPDLLRKAKGPVILGINKVDLVAKPALLPLIDGYRDICPFAAIIPLSALTGAGEEALLQEVLQHLPEGPCYFPPDQVTDLPERFIVAEMIREQILGRIRDEVPYGVAVLVERFQENPERNLVGIDAVIHVERDSQKGILIGRGGSMLKQIGQAARREIERLLGVQVHLQLFVRVQKNWTTSGRMLREFGYE
ncbi:MAG: GTPase Era [Desulfuromonadales bacterium]|nr:GTPase Era [Desulfuromonadales bacterium]